MPDTFLGALIRPTDPREQAYSLVRTLPPRSVDLSQPRLLSQWQGRDIRMPIGDQGQMGACAAFASAYAVMEAGLISGRDIQRIAPGPLYEQARRKQGWFPGDTGSYIADCLDLLLTGGPAEVQPYVANAAFDYDEAAWTDAATRDYEGSHRPFYPAEGQFTENVWLALDAGMPVVIGTYWPNEWFNPDQNGSVNPGAFFGPDTGAHATRVWGIVPGFYLCANQWSPGWNAQAVNFGYDCRPGDFVIPWTAVDRGLFFEARAVSFEPVPVPQPQPEPQPSDCRADAILQAAYDVTTALEYADTQHSHTNRVLHNQALGARKVFDAAKAAAQPGGA